ncbi:MAG TPA: choice-of-anchor J domain-containing protein, partial [Chitinophagaceae bacterium]|nr:choice-of-anchor J domain-containing protein [Chitinophagaceae bacterium]
VRIAAGAPAGAANGTIGITSTGATAQNVTLSGTVNAAVTVDPLQRFHAFAVSSTEIDLTDTANATGNNVIIAYNTTASFGTPSGALTVGSTISGGGTIIYNGPPANTTAFLHTGLTPATTYYYSAWSVDASNNYSTALTANATTFGVPANVVINQIYGGGGNTGGIYKNDFIELYNNESTPVSLAGWTVQYSSAAGTSWQLTKLGGTIPAHGFYLVQEGVGADLTQPALPTPDATGTIAMSATNGKVLLCNTIVARFGANPGTTPGYDTPDPQVMDKAGYGTANGYEGSGPAAALTNSTADYRVTDGVDNNNNAADFTTGTPIARNSSYTVTAPAIVSLSPPNGITGIPSTLKPTIVFDKPLVKGTGTITVYENNVAGTPIDVSSSSIVISNRSTVTINTPLLPGKSYSILISSGAFTDVYGNAFAGISSNTGWAFTTYNAAVATTLPATFDFQNCTGNGLLPNGFTQYSVTGAQVWDCTVFGRDPAAPAGTAPFANGVQINGYANGINNQNKDWLISPKLDLTGTTYPLLSFYSRNAFDGDPLELKISTDYTGSGDPSLATWTNLNGKFPSKGSDVWTLSGGINLSSYKQNSVYIAFVYTSTTDDGSRWSLDDINLVNSSTPPPPSLTLSSNNMEFGYTATGS